MIKAVTIEARRIGTIKIKAITIKAIKIKEMKTNLFALVALLVPVLGHAEPCKVVDQELQGFFEGRCWNGLADGKGHARGSAEYVGEFRKGMKHGRGVKTWSWGDRYEGEFRDDHKHGKGMYVWGAGTQWAGQRYVGEFVADAREGWGTYFWPNGDRFDGQWKEDLRYGYTAMEQRREVARKAREEALGQPGTPVCMLASVGIGREAMLRGVTAGLEEGRLNVTITAVSAADPEALPAFRSGDTVQSEIWEWTPCS